MRKSVSGLLQELFKSEEKNITMERFYEIVGDSSGNSLTNALFLFINDSLDMYDGKEDLDYICRGLDFMNLSLENNPGINRKIIKKKLNKLIEKIDRMKIENKDKFYDNIKASKELGKVSEQIYSVEESTKIKESKQYNLLKIIINDTKNLDYLEQTFIQIPNSVNVLDKDGNPLFLNLLKKYVEKLESCKDNKEDILYYNNIILLMKHQSNFELTDRQKSDCLNIISSSLDNLNVREKEFMDKKEFLSNIKDTIVDDQIDKIGFSDLTSKYNISIGFNNSLIDELGIYQTSVSKENYPDRMLVDDYIVTIDGDSAVEIDDGLSIKKMKNNNYLLGVHIASPLSYIPFNSSIIDEAVSRASSIYLPRGVKNDIDSSYTKIIPLFPYSFSADTAALKQDLYRLARSYYFEIDKDGEVVDQKFFKTIVKNSKKCSYNEVNNILSCGSNNKQLEETLLLLDELTYKLEEKYNPQDIYEAIKSKSQNPANVIVDNSRAGKIVNKTMMLTGSKVADFFAHSKEGYPTLYRVHSIEQEDMKNFENEIKSLSSVYDKQKYNKLYQTLLGMYPKAKYDVSGGHDGLGLKHYCHCTSPLRRGADIIVGHSLDVCYFSNPSDKDLGKLEEEINNAKYILNAKNNDIELFLNEYNRDRKCRGRCKVKTKR